MNINNCGCTQTPCTPVQCGCPVYLSSDCINDVKSVFECSEIETGLDLTTTLELMMQYVCDRFEALENYFTLINVGEGAEIYAGANLLGQKKIRSLVSSDDSVSITQQTDEIDITVDAGVKCLTSEKESIEITEGENGCINIDVALEYNAENLGTGRQVYKEEVDGLFRFRTLTSTNSSVTITQNANTLDFSVATPSVVDGSETKLNSGTTTVVTGNGTVSTPYVVEVERLQKTISANYTLTNADHGYTIIVNATASDINITVPSGLSSKFACYFIQQGTNDVTFVGSSTTINTPTGLIIKGENYWAYLEQVLATNVFQLLGSLKV